MKAEPEEESPRRVLLFAGHMIDKPDRGSPRFPPDKVPVAARAIEEALAGSGAGPGDLAFCGGACGGDLLFAESCLRRGIRLEIRLPFPEPVFLARSVDFAGPDWRARFFDATRHPLTTVDVLPAGGASDPDPFTRTNLWLLDSALSYGAEKLLFVCLWDGRPGDGPGGTQHLVEKAAERGAKVRILDTRSLFHPGEPVME